MKSDLGSGKSDQSCFGDQQVLVFKMASKKGCLSINEVIATLENENDSEIDSNSSSGLDVFSFLSRGEISS